MKKQFLLLYLLLLSTLVFSINPVSAYKDLKKGKKDKAFEYFLKIKTKIFSVLVFSIFIIGCTQSNKEDENSWDIASKSNTIESYNEYLSRFPNGKFKNKADSTIQVLVWYDAKRKNTPEIYEQYLTKYPSGYYVTIADSLFEEALWKSAKSTLNMEQYIKYKTKFSNGKYIETANKHITDYLIEGNHIGAFKINMQIPVGNYRDFNIRKTKNKIFTPEETDGYFIDTCFFVYQKNEKLLELRVYENKISRIIVLSDKFKTKKNISINSSIKEFIEKYSDYFIVEELSGLTAPESYDLFLIGKGEDGVYFLLNEKDYQHGSNSINSSNPSKDIKIFKANSKILKIFVDNPSGNYEQYKNMYDKNIADTEKEKQLQKEAKKENGNKSAQNLPYFLSRTKWSAQGGDIRIKFLDDKYLEMYMPVVGNKKCAFIVNKESYFTGTISFDIGNQSIELNYNTRLETLFKVNGLNNYLNFTQY
jgi:hypothetical protein